MPLVITHGWPGSFFEMYKIIPLLTDPGSHGGDPADAFDVVVPSMPGYGFSDHPTQRGMHVFKVADLWAKLMTEGLGYQRFGAQGGDWGASVTNYLGFAYPRNLMGIHTTSMTRPTPYLGPGSRALSAAETDVAGRSARPGCRPKEATPTSRALNLRRCPMASTTRQRGWRPGSWKNTAPGVTATGRSRADLPRTSCSRPLPSTGSPRPSIRPPGCTMRR